jgi:glutamyl-Q tRNA(Asp) synthetase
MKSKRSKLAVNYIGRFAPSPTGPLHFGSLVAALASHLDARSNGGQWRVRMEDLDPPREVPGAANAIISSLEKHGLTWDGDILYQSQRATAYADILAHLDTANLLYPCYCSRRSTIAAGGVYPGTCRRGEPPSGKQRSGALKALRQNHEPAALRLKTSALPDAFSHASSLIEFDDLIFGLQRHHLSDSTGDFIVRRKDDLIAYQLAVVVDDIAQRITHVIRGSDLLGATAQQIFLWQLLGAPLPVYGHIPVATDRAGQKLSKQRGAAPLDDTEAASNLCRALHFLGQPAPDELHHASCPEILQWAVAHWNRHNIPRTPKLPVTVLPTRKLTP